MAPTPDEQDTQPRAHESPIDYANHTDLAAGERMTDARLDLALDEGAELIGRSDFGADVSCCLRLIRG